MAHFISVLLVEPSNKYLEMQSRLKKTEIQEHAST